MANPAATKLALASMWVYRAATGLDDPAGSPSYVLDPEGTTLSEESAATILAAEAKPVRLSVTRQSDALRIARQQLTEPVELQFLRRRSLDTRAYWQKQLRLVDSDIKVLFGAGRLRMMLTFEEYIAWLGEYSLNGTAMSASGAAHVPEAKAAGAQIYVEGSKHSGEIWVWRFSGSR